MNPPLPLVPKSMYPCKRCHRTPQINNTCHVCLRTLLDESRALIKRHQQPDRIVTRFGVDFDWKDRLRLLFHGNARLEVATSTQFSPGHVASSISVTVRPLVEREVSPIAALEAGESK